MNCTANALIDAARCFNSIPNHMQQPVAISLLCEWINSVCEISWNPASAAATWKDGLGVHSGDLTTFRSTADLETVSVLNLNVTNIDSLTGLECLPNLKELSATDNKLSGTLDLTVCPLLESVQLLNNLLEDVNVAGLSNLLLLDVVNNVLTTTAVSNILAQLDANGAINGEVALNLQDPLAPPSQVGRNAAANLISNGWTVVLDEISWSPAVNTCDWVDSGGPNSGNLAFFLANADFDTVTSLTTDVFASTTSISGLQGLIGLQTLVISDNGLTTLDCRNCFSLQTIACSGGLFMSSLLLAGNTSLVTLDCSGSALLTLNLTGCVSLVTLKCDVNSLTSLDLSTTVSLVSLNCSGNTIDSLDLSSCPHIVDVTCTANAITSITLTGCSNLDALYCSGNSLNTLDLSPSPSLRYLSCDTNSLTSLDVSVCSGIINLVCDFCSITSLDLTGCTSLSQIFCGFNSMNQAAVDNVLCQTDTNGKLNGTLDIVNNSPPSAAGLVCDGNLIGKGWTVTHD